MPAPGDSEVLLRRLGTAGWEAILPRGRHRLSVPSRSGAQGLAPLAQVRETENQAVGSPGNQGLVALLRPQPALSPMLAASYGARHSESP